MQLDGPIHPIVVMCGRFGLAALIGMLTLSPAQATFGTEVAEALVAAMEAPGTVQVTYESANNVGDQVTITGFSGNVITGHTLEVPTIVLDGVRMREAGGFIAQHVSAEGIRFASGDSLITVETAEGSGVTIPSAEESRSQTIHPPFSHAGNGRVYGVRLEGRTLVPISVEELRFEFEVDSNGFLQHFEFSFTSAAFPITLWRPSPDVSFGLKDLGYTDLVFDFGFTASQDGEVLNIRDFTLVMEDGYRVTAEAKLSGVPKSGLYADVSSPVGADSVLHFLAVRFENTGLIDRALDLQAKVMSLPRDEMIAQFVGALPLVLNALQNPRFQGEAAAAGAAFLTDPRSIEFTAEPATPVTLGEIESIANMAPESLVDVLSISVVANQ